MIAREAGSDVKRSHRRHCLCPSAMPRRCPNWITHARPSLRHPVPPTSPWLHYRGTARLNCTQATPLGLVSSRRAAPADTSSRWATAPREWRTYVASAARRTRRAHKGTGMSVGPHKTSAERHRTRLVDVLCAPSVPCRRNAARICESPQLQPCSRRLRKSAPLRNLRPESLDGWHLAGLA